LLEDRQDNAEAVTEAVQRPTMKFVATKAAGQLDLQAPHWVRDRLVGQRAGITNQIRTLPLERSAPVSGAKADMREDRAKRRHRIGPSHLQYCSVICRRAASCGRAEVQWRTFWRHAGRLAAMLSPNCCWEGRYGR
jgi:hypothetical protein